MENENKELFKVVANNSDKNIQELISLLSKECILDYIVNFVSAADDKFYKIDKGAADIDIDLFINKDLFESIFGYETQYKYVAINKNGYPIIMYVICAEGCEDIDPRINDNINRFEVKVQYVTTDQSGHESVITGANISSVFDTSRFSSPRWKEVESCC